MLKRSHVSVQTYNFNTQRLSEKDCHDLNATLTLTVSTRPGLHKKFLSHKLQRDKGSRKEQQRKEIGHKTFKKMERKLTLKRVRSLP